MNRRDNDVGVQRHGINVSTPWETRVYSLRTRVSRIQTPFVNVCAYTHTRAQRQNRRRMQRYICTQRGAALSRSLRTELLVLNALCNSLRISYGTTDRARLVFVRDTSQQRRT